MKKFSKNEMKKANENKNIVGNWDNKPVFACSYKELDKQNYGCCYILYDDENKLVIRVYDKWKCIGIVNENGGVQEYKVMEDYEIDEDNEINNTLRKARNITIEELLGFKYEEVD